MRGDAALLLITALLAVVFGLMYTQDREDRQRLDTFHSRCDSKGGTVLNSTLPGNVKWIGCYSGVKEIPNEE